MKEFNDKKTPKDLNKDKTTNTGRPADVNRINQGGHQTGGGTGAGRTDLGHLNKDKDKTDKR